MALPEITEPSVAPRPISLPQAGPDAFGAPVGQATQTLGTDLGKILAHERQMTAAFDAQDRELKYGTENDKLEESFKNDLRTLNAGDTDSYQKLVTDRLAKLSKDREQLRSKYEASLSDPIARKSYAIRTRLQTQMTERQALTFADGRVRDWRRAQTDQTVALNAERSGNVLPDLAATLESFQVLRESSHDAILLGHLDGEPRQVSEMKIRESDRKMATSALDGYNSKTDHSGALAFLASTLPDGTHVQFDPAHKDEPFLLTTAEAKKYEAHFTAMKTQKTGDALGMQWYMDGADPKVESRKLVAAAPEDQKAMAYESAYKATMAHAAMVGKDFAATEHARTMATQGAQNFVARGGRLEDALQKFPAADAGTVMGVEQRTTRWATEPLVARLNSLTTDPANAGFSLAIDRQALNDRMAEQRIPVAAQTRINRAIDKDALAMTAITKSPGAAMAISNARDSALASVGYGRGLTGKTLSDLPPGWKRDVVEYVEMEVTSRIAKTGEKTLAPADALRISHEVEQMIPSLKDKAKAAGKLELPKYEGPKGPRTPTVEQTAAGARIMSTFSGGAAPVSSNQDPTQPGLRGPDQKSPVLVAGDQAAYTALPDGAEYYVMQNGKPIKFKKGAK